MPEQPMTPDLVERVRTGLEAFGRGDLDEALKFFARDAVWHSAGGELFEGLAAIRDFLEQVHGSFANIEIEVEDVRDFGGEVLLAVNTIRGQPLGGLGEVRQRGAFVYEGNAGFAVRGRAYTNIDEARAAAELLAQERM